jgi:predicted RNase H-like nuclease (RuvC/YqgF family)
MTTANSNPNASKQRLTAIAAVIVAALLIVNGILLYSYLSQKKVAEQTTAELEETDRLKAELQNQYDEALAELESMRDQNTELNSLIDEKSAELKDARDKIDRLIKNDLGSARSEIKNLKSQVERFVAEINNLKAQNEQLAASNTQLQEEKSLLVSDLDQQRMANEELSATKAALVSEREELASRNQDLSKTVNFASMVKVAKIEATGYSVRESGKAVKKTAAKNVEQVEICFNTTANEVTRPGTEFFYVRIINPMGETLAVDELGSGIMTSGKNNERIRYTQVKEHSYNNDAGQVCTVWAPNIPFQPGLYQIQVYNKGFLAGEGSLKLK